MAKVNGFDTAKAEPFLKRIETLQGDLETLKGKYMSECKSVREDMKEILAEAGDAGIPKKALKGLVKYRELERRQSEIGDDLQGEDESIFDALVDQLGELGAAAKRAARTAAKNDGSRASAH